MKDLVKMGCCAFALLIIAGCAADDPDSNPQAPPPAPVSSPAVFPLPQAPEPEKAKAPEISVSIDWSSEKGPASALLKRRLSAPDGGRLLGTTREIVVPAEVPKALRFSAELSDAVADPIVIGEAWPKSDPAKRRALQIQNPKAEGGSSTLSFDVIGVDEILPRNQEEKAVFTFRVIDRAGASVPLTIQLVLGTPPSKVEIHQAALTDFLASGGALPEGVKSLRARISRWDLLQVITIKNRSEGAIAMETPAILTGKVSTHFHRITVNQQPCRYDLQDSQWDEVLGSELYLLPIDPELPARFSSILNERLGENRLEVILASGEQKVFGIYGAGGKIPDLVDHGPLRSVMQPQAVVSSCHSVCGNTRTEMFGWNIVRALPHWTNEGFPGASRACSKAQCIEQIQVPVYTPDLCNECAIWELGNGTAPWDFDRRFCWGDGPGNPWGRPAIEHWHVDKSGATVSSGLETFPVTLEISGESQGGRIRFQDSPEGTRSEARGIQLIQEKTIQVK